MIFHRKSKLISNSVTSFLWVCLVHVHCSDELFRVNRLLTLDAVNSVLNPITRHDIQASGSILQQIY